MKAYVFLIMIFLLVVGCDGGKIIYYQTEWNEFEDNVGSFHTIKIDGTDDKVIIEDLKIPKLKIGFNKVFGYFIEITKVK